MRLITPLTSLDTSMLLKRFPRSGFFNFGNKSKAGGLMSGLYGGWDSTCHPYFSKISDTAPEEWGRAVSYGRWSLSEIWLQSVSSPISRLRFAEQGPRSLPARTHCTLLKSGSQLSPKSERLHHPTGRASAVCRTFEMTPVLLCNELCYSVHSSFALILGYCSVPYIVTVQPVQNILTYAYD